MKSTLRTHSRTRTVFAFVGTTLLVALAAISIALVSRAAQASAGDERNGEIHVLKECSAYTGAAGSFCTITSSNLPEIKVGSKVFYDQVAGIPTGLLDSSVVLDAGTGDWAVGRCTLDLGTGLGLCTFSDGTGPFTGFHARVNVSYAGGPNYRWDGTYSFSPEPPRSR
jgi:hypothetical protein